MPNEENDMGNHTILQAALKNQKIVSCLILDEYDGKYIQVLAFASIEDGGSFHNICGVACCGLVGWIPIAYVANTMRCPQWTFVEKFTKTPPYVPIIGQVTLKWRCVSVNTDGRLDRPI